MRQVRGIAGGPSRQQRQHRARAPEGVPAPDETARRLLLGASDVPYDRRKSAAEHRDRPDRSGARSGAGRERTGVIVCKSPAEIERMRVANALVADVLAELGSMVAPGVTTGDLDAEAERLVRDYGAEPAFTGYRGYPATLCASINEQVVHGIPSARKLLSGDIVSLDMGVKLNGLFGDSAITVPVGEVSDDVLRLLKVTQEALEKGIEQVRLGGRISDIGHAIQNHVEANGFSVVREFVGHGIGASLHEEPQIANYGEPGRGPRLAEGMVLAIEPMVNMGRPAVKVLADGWTAVTRDGSLSAHFEHTVAVTKDGPVVLTHRTSPAGVR